MKTLRMNYVLDGDPVALARPRFTPHNSHAYDSQKQVRLVTGITLLSQHGDLPLFEGPLRLDINFYLKYSSTRSSHLEGKLHTRVPDIDNLIKFICDISTGIIYADDRIVAEIFARKRFSKKPRTEFTVSRVDL